MLQEMVHPPDSNLLMQQEDVSSPISTQLLEFCEADFFQETLQNSEVTSSSNGCCYEVNSSYTSNNISFPYADINNFNNSEETSNGTTAPATKILTSTTAIDSNNNISDLSIIFDSSDELDNEISASIDFSSSPTSFSVPQFFPIQQDPLIDFSTLEPQLTLSEIASPLLMMPPPPPPPSFEDDCLTSVPSCDIPSFNSASPTCSFLGPSMSTYLQTGTMSAPLSADSPKIFSSGLLFRSDAVQHMDKEFRCDGGGIYCPDSIKHVFNRGDHLSSIGNGSRKFMVGSTSSTALSTDMSSLEDSTFKVGKLSVEQRKEKIHRYMKKRNERNFTKKIKYACRKTLADSRPRVRGRFAKNDDFAETNHGTACRNQEEEDDDEVAAKDEEDMVDSAEIFAHISGVNSFQCTFPIQSWI